MAPSPEATEHACRSRPTPQHAWARALASPLCDNCCWGPTPDAALLRRPTGPVHGHPSTTHVEARSPAQAHLEVGEGILEQADGALGQSVGVEGLLGGGRLQVLGGLGEDDHLQNRVWDCRECRLGEGTAHLGSGGR